MQNTEASLFPTGDQNNVQPEYGMTKYEHALLQITCAYITAGSTGMPDSEALLGYAEATTIEYFKTLDNSIITNRDTD